MEREGSDTFVHRGIDADQATPDDRTPVAEGHHPTAPTPPHTAAETPRDLSTLSSAPVDNSFAALIPDSAENLQRFGYIIHITIGQNRETLYLPIDQCFMTQFCEGLGQHNFQVFVFDVTPGTDYEVLTGMTGRVIHEREVYSHYMDFPASELHAEFNADGPPRKRQQIDGETPMQRAMRWLEEQKAKITHTMTPQITDAGA
jgi:hypothetical protein